MREKRERNVYYDRTHDRYKVQVGVDGKDITIGNYRSKGEAMRARDKWVAENGWRPVAGAAVNGPHYRTVARLEQEAELDEYRKELEELEERREQEEARQTDKL